MTKNLFCLLSACLGIFPLFAQQHVPFENTIAPRNAALVLDSVRESRYLTPPSSDSLVYRRELYTYFGDTVYEKKTLELQFPLPDYTTIERVFYRVNPATGQNLSETTLVDEGFGEDTTGLLINYYRPGNPALLDSTKFFRNNIANGLLTLGNARRYTYNAQGQRIQEVFSIYKLSDGSILLATKTDYYYNQNGLVDSNRVYQITPVNPNWQPLYKHYNHYTANLQLDSVFRYSYSAGSFAPSVITAYGYDDQERLNNFRLFSYNNSFGAPLLILEQLYIRDDQGRIVELQEISYTEGFLTGETKTFFTYVEDNYYHLETEVVLDVTINQYLLDHVREYFYSGFVEAAEPAVADPLQVFPNPADAAFFLETPSGARVQVYDASGRLVLQRLCPTDGLQSIDVSGLPGGVYYVRAGGKTGIFIKNRG